MMNQDGESSGELDPQTGDDISLRGKSLLSDVSFNKLVIHLAYHPFFHRDDMLIDGRNHFHIHL